MEDETRPLPDGWIRQFDAKENHQFFVDTRAKPPRAIWHHPFDDDEYLGSLTTEERERLQEEEKRRILAYNRVPTPNPFHSSDEEEDNEAGRAGDTKKSRPRLSTAGAGAGAGAATAERTSSTAGTADLPPRPDEKKKGLSGFGRRMKDKVTGTTHDQRVQDRARRAEEERAYYEAHRKFRQALQRAEATGQPVLFAKDRDGRDVYVEPPSWGAYGGPGGGIYGGRPGMGMAGPAGYGPGGYGPGGYGWNPYTEGVYMDPNARFIRPANPYNRPYGGGYGGGMGLPLMGGLMGGMLLGGLLF